MNCGVWRYHPDAEGVRGVARHDEPLGLDWDEYGQMFITNCVIEHVFHIVPGGHYKRMYGQDLNPHTYGLIDRAADHIHWGGGHWTSSRGGEGEHYDAGGGHAHAGALIYLGDNWPRSYRNRVHVQHPRQPAEPGRAGASRLGLCGEARKTSCSPTTRGSRLAACSRPGRRGVCRDWNDTGECHSTGVIHRETGRMYKVVYGQPKPQENLDLGQAQAMKISSPCNCTSNDWQVRHARRRCKSGRRLGQDMAAVNKLLHKQFDEQTDTTRKLRLPVGVVRHRRRERRVLDRTAKKSGRGSAALVRAVAVRCQCPIGGHAQAIRRAGQRR